MTEKRAVGKSIGDKKRRVFLIKNPHKEDSYILGFKRSWPRGTDIEAAIRKTFTTKTTKGTSEIQIGLSGSALLRILRLITSQLENEKNPET